MTIILTVNNGDTGFQARTKINDNATNLNVDKIESTDTRIPTQDENNALAGTDGVPSGTNQYVTNSDARNTNSRTCNNTFDDAATAKTNLALVKADVGLGNVDNTSDADKPISTATQSALDGKKDDFVENTAFNKNFGTALGDVTQGNDTRIPTQDENNALAGTDGVPSGTNQYVTNSDARNTNSRTCNNTFDDAATAKTNLALVKADVGLGNVDNTSDADKPISTATQTALDNKADELVQIQNTASTAFTLGPTGDVVRTTAGSAVTITLPNVATQVWPIGSVVTVIQGAAGTVTFSPGAGVTIDSLGGNLSISGQHGSVSVLAVAGDLFLISGALA